MSTPRVASPASHPTAWHFTAAQDAAGLAALRDLTTRHRLAARIDHSGGVDACHPWTGSVSTSGYARLRVVVAGQRREVRPERCVWALRHGPIADGAVIVRACATRTCMNHLTLGLLVDAAARELALGRNYWAAKTMCPAGHSLTDPANIKLDGGSRKCRVCISVRILEDRAANPGRYHEHSRALWARVVADPIRHEKKRAYLRSWYSANRKKTHTRDITGQRSGPAQLST